jgi:hypothetical protein
MLEKQAKESQLTGVTPTNDTVVESTDPMASKLDSTIKKLKDANLPAELVEQVQNQMEQEATEKARSILSEVNKSFE